MFSIDKFSNRYLSFFSVVTISIIIIFFYFCFNFVNKSLIPVKTENRKIILNIDFTEVQNIDKIQISVMNGNNKIVTKKDIYDDHNVFILSEGQHGNIYKFDVSAIEKGKVVKNFSSSAMFLDYTKMPKFRLLEIDTLNGKNVYYEKVSPPKDCWGATLKNNLYSSAEIKVYEKGDLVDEKKIRIKARGNTSAYGKKLPYMLTFEDEYELISGCKSKKWILLNFSDLRYVLGNHLVNAIQGYDGPKYGFVNVVFNGDYKGSYIAVEPIVDFLLRDGCVTKRGVIVENDPYWWNETTYFKTSRQIYAMAYTFKYPKIKGKLGWNISQKVKDIFEKYENVLYERNEKYNDFINESSFIDWLLVHDILAIWDGGGSNMFMYLKNLEGTSKITMGPSWDFDAMFSKEVMGKWESIHRSSILNFPKLLSKNEFRKLYKNRWNVVRCSTLSNTEEYLKKWFDRNFADVEESWRLNSIRWGTEKISISSNTKWILVNLRERIGWMDKEISGL